VSARLRPDPLGEFTSLLYILRVYIVYLHGFVSFVFHIFMYIADLLSSYRLKIVVGFRLSRQCKPSALYATARINVELCFVTRQLQQITVIDRCGGTRHVAPLSVLWGGLVEVPTESTLLISQSLNLHSSHATWPINMNIK